MAPLLPLPRSVTLLALPLAALACTPTPTPASAPDPAPASAPVSASASASASAPAPASASASAPASAPATPPPPAIRPLSPDEQKEAERKCKPLLDAIAQRKKTGAGGNPLELFEKILEKPPARMSKPDLDRCTDLVRRGLASYLQAAMEAEATMMLRQIGRSMAAAYEREELDPKGTVAHALCPSAPPIPANLEAVRGKPYVSSPAEWDAPGWKCLHFQLTGNQRFQYEVKSDPRGKSFVVLGRAPSADGARIVEFRLEGVVGDKDSVVLRDVARAERAP